jgi:hypothetical protein
MRRLSLVVLLLAGAACTGCVRGFIYTDVTVPLDTNMAATPRGGEVGESDSRQVELPVGGMRIGAEWNTRAIGDAARAQGLKRVHYADLRTVSVLGGVWLRQTAKVWGEE